MCLDKYGPLHSSPFPSARCPPKLSWTWRAISSAYSTISEGFTRVISDGKDTSILEHPWLFYLPLRPFFFSTEALASFGDPLEVTVASLLCDHAWNQDLIIEFF